MVWVNLALVIWMSHRLGVLMERAVCRGLYFWNIEMVGIVRQWQKLLMSRRLFQERRMSLFFIAWDLGRRKP